MSKCTQPSKTCCFTCTCITMSPQLLLSQGQLLISALKIWAETSPIWSETFSVSTQQASTLQKKQILTIVLDVADQVDNLPNKLENSLAHITLKHGDYTICINGSTRKGGAAALAIRRSPLEPQILEAIKTKWT